MTKIPTLSDTALLEQLQRDAFGYFLHEVNPENGLVADTTRKNSPASIAVVGFALAAYVVATERGFMTRAQAVQRTLATLRFFWHSLQSDSPDATGYRGFYYHFLDMQSGKRAWQSELSLIDTTLLLAGALTARAYFIADVANEREIRDLADSLYRRVDWQWAQNEGSLVSHGWKPECGFLNYGWGGYSEAILIYVLGMGSPTYPLPFESHRAWTCTYQWENLYGYDVLYAGPLFIHQFSHVWIDFRKIQDQFMREKNSDYFENTRRATYVQREYALRNPGEFKGYNENCWGYTADDGPGAATVEVDGRERRFFGYAARGVPYGPDDGTLAAWAALASLPFAPEIALPAVRHFCERYPEMMGKYGFTSGFNPTYPAKSECGWISEGYFGLDQGIIVLMIENYRSELLWKLMRQCPYLKTGLRRAGFKGGWL